MHLIFPLNSPCELGRWLEKSITVFQVIVFNCSVHDRFNIAAAPYVLTSFHCFLFWFSVADFCNQHRCQNGASCINGLVNYTCSCRGLWAGVYCETAVPGTMCLTLSLKSAGFDLRLPNQQHIVDNVMTYFSSKRTYKITRITRKNVPIYVTFTIKVTLRFLHSFYENFRTTNVIESFSKVATFWCWTSKCDDRP